MQETDTLRTTLIERYTLLYIWIRCKNDVFGGGTPPIGVRFVVLGYDIGDEDGAEEYIHYFCVIPIVL